MNYLSVDGLSKRFGELSLFENISFGVDQGQKVALVGVNGCGKSTLLKVLADHEGASEGAFSFNKSIKVRFLDQNPNVEGHASILDYVLSGDDVVTQTVRKYEHAILVGSDDISDLLELMDNYNAWDFESQATQILGKLDIHDLQQPIDQLSGGQLKRVALAKVLIEKPEMLILDEPTNHLDLDSIEWLEQYLSKQKMSLLLVTHDRYFLEGVTNEILELSNQEIYQYKGSYSYFLEKKLEREQVDAKNIEKARSLMSTELDWIRRQPKARGTKAKYRIDAFEGIKEKANSKVATSNVEINLNGSRMGKKILELDHISKSYDDLKLIEDFSYTFKRGDKIGIVGKNGCGKSTFLNLIADGIQPDKGEIIAGETVKFGYYRQTSLEYKEDDKVIDIVKNVADIITTASGSVITASQLLNQFSFSPKRQYDFVRKLSGGEKRRLQLLQVLMGNPNFLVLDEPTNDLDLITLNTLEDYLLNFGGCMLIVSHDRYFMDRLVDHIFAFEGDGFVRDYPGNFTDYRLLEKSPEFKKDKPKKKATPAPKQTEKKKLNFTEQKEYENIEGEIAAFEKKKEELESLLNSGEQNHEKLTGWSTEIDGLNNAIAEKEDRWLELSEMI